SVVHPAPAGNETRRARGEQGRFVPVNRGASMVLNVPLLRDSFALVVDREPQVVHDFYEILFERYPRVQPLFRRARAEQAKMMTAALVAVMDHLEDAL